MPHVTIQHFPHELTAAQKQQLSTALPTLIVDSFGVSESAVSIALEPVPPGRLGCRSSPRRGSAGCIAAVRTPGNIVRSGPVHPVQGGGRLRRGEEHPLPEADSGVPGDPVRAGHRVPVGRFPGLLLPLQRLPQPAPNRRPGGDRPGSSNVAILGVTSLNADRGTPALIAGSVVVMLLFLLFLVAYQAADLYAALGQGRHDQAGELPGGSHGQDCSGVRVHQASSKRRNLADASPFSTGAPVKRNISSG